MKNKFCEMRCFIDGDTRGLCTIQSLSTRLPLLYRAGIKQVRSYLHGYGFYANCCLLHALFVGSNGANLSFPVEFGIPDAGEICNTDPALCDKNSWIVGFVNSMPYISIAVL